MAVQVFFSFPCLNLCDIRICNCSNAEDSSTMANCRRMPDASLWRHSGLAICATGLDVTPET